MKKYILLGTRVVVLGLIIIFSFVSCKKKPEQIGADLQPDQDRIQLHFTDTISITAYSVREDSVRTDEPAQMLLGSMKDPVFGTTVAGFYTQLRLSTNAPDFGPNPVLDSLVLQLVYSGYYGDTTSTQTIRIYELNDQLFLDSTYYSTSQLAHESVEIAHYQFQPRPRTLFPFLGDTLPPLIRISLSDISTELGNRILNTPEESLETGDAFAEYFKGIFVTADPVSSDGVISYFNLPSNLSRATLYYQNDNNDSLRYELFISANTPRFNRFDHFDYTDADAGFRQQVIEGDTTLGKNRLYLQSMGGVKTFLRFPHLNKFAEQLGSNIAVNEAKLIFTGFEPDPEIPAPAQLVLVERTDNEGNYRIMSDQLEGDAYFGGNYKASTNEYQFRISRYAQRLIKGDSNDMGLYAFIVGASAKADRWVYQGTGPSEADTIPAFRLHLIYSTVD